MGHVIPVAEGKEYEHRWKQAMASKSSAQTHDTIQSKSLVKLTGVGNLFSFHKEALKVTW